MYESTDRSLSCLAIQNVNFGGHSARAHLQQPCRNRDDLSHHRWHRWQRASSWDGSSLERACWRSRFHFDFICIGHRHSLTSICSIAPTGTCEGGGAYSTGDDQGGLVRLVSESVKLGRVSGRFCGLWLFLERVRC